MMNRRRWYDYKGKTDIRNSFALFVGLPVFIILIILTALGTRLLINPQQVAITEKGIVTMTRTYPLKSLFGYPIIRYTHSVTPLNRDINFGFVCRDDNGVGQRYNHDIDGIGKWDLNYFAEECISSSGFIYSITYTGLFLDTIPLRPIEVEVIVPPREITYIIP